MSFLIVMAQLNLTVGDISGNADKIIEAAEKAKDQFKAEIVIFPELTLTGYPPEDLLLRPSFIKSVETALQKIIDNVSGIHVLIGYPKKITDDLFNAAGLIYNGKIEKEYLKHELPNYSVFDEKRYFTAGSEPCVFELHGTAIAITICEDIWKNSPVEKASHAGAKVILNLNASPFDKNKTRRREALLTEQSRKHGVSICYVNLVGGQDELVFDGGSMVVDPAGSVVSRAGFFTEQLHCVELTETGLVTVSGKQDVPDTLAMIYNALVTGIRDYSLKNGFTGAVLGLSGGIDSAVVLALAAAALGPENIEVALMPSEYTSDMSNEDAVKEAINLGVKYSILPIEKPFEAFNDLLAEEFSGLEPDITEENIQARCRGILLMALSNKKRKILLTTGNKSEMSVGYATLYGDMAGGFAPIKDCPKLLVYELANYINRNGEVIPQRVIDRPPSAELRPDQKDSDSLPDYLVLDAILERYVELDHSSAEIIAAGFDAETVKRVIRLVDINEYKRRQAPPGVKITLRAYGRDRRYPMTNKFRSDML
jgi:NAD+ synthase (glutamine-hydrolysing)